MFNYKKVPNFFIYAFCIFTSAFSVEINDDTKDYIVYMGSIPHENYVSSLHHINILNQVVTGRSAEESLIRSYKRSFNGFATKLTENEYENLKNFEGVVSVFPSRTYYLQTTRSWDFLGFPLPATKPLNVESDIVIGVLDSGIWPESPSFNDDGLSPVPKKWQGACFGGQNFTCNKKIVVARHYEITARDHYGHGTHTASTAAGRTVEGVNFYGLANGTARGGVPSARIAAYKICADYRCAAHVILAAFDDAIADGVDLITISVGSSVAYDISEDPLAIGSFHAMSKGILTVQAAGNSGDGRATTTSSAPWVFTVAASSIDRRFITKVVLGNGKTLIGESVNSFVLEEDKYPLLYGKGPNGTGCTEDEIKACLSECIDTSKANGSILVCDGSGQYEDVLKNGGALGMLDLPIFKNVSWVPPLPSASFDDVEFAALKSYLNSTKTPEGKIYKSETVNDTTAPVVAVFSSRGPNRIVSDILKPDITAPGVDILAAFSPVGPVSDIEEDPRSVNYNIISGTSMACPHVTGAAAHVKSLHLDWSAAAIKSALMTTAVPMSPSKNKDAEFAYGSGHLNPNNASNPGLVYDTTPGNYITFLCNLGYDQQKIGLITGNTNVTCANNTHNSSPKDVNYPSISALVDAQKPFTLNFSRTVTNVGISNSTYKAKVVQGSKIKVQVKPDLLSFKSLQEAKSFKVVVVGEGLSSVSQDSASIVWYDGIHSVRSPVVVYTN